MSDISREAPDDPKDQVSQSPEESSCSCGSSSANAIDVAKYLRVARQDLEFSVEQILDTLRWVDQMLSDVYEDHI